MRSPLCLLAKYVTIALINGASLTLTSIGRYLPCTAQVKNKIKCVDRLLGNESLHRDIPLIFRSIISMLTNRLSFCVIAVDWSGYPFQEYHVLRASLICDGRSIPLLSWIIPSEKQQNSQVQKSPLPEWWTRTPESSSLPMHSSRMHGSGISGHSAGILSVVSEAIFRCALFSRRGEYWFRRQELQASSKPEYLGPGTLEIAEYAQCDGHFYLHKKEPKGRKHKHSRCRIKRKSQARDGRSSAKEPWLLFSSTDNFKPREIMKLYSH